MTVETERPVILQLDRLVKRYGNNVAIDQLSLEVLRGEVFGFLGPNGAGKTTTIKMIVGLTLPTAGRVIVGGHDVTVSPMAAKRLIGYVPDQPNAYEKLTGREFLVFVSGLFGMESEQTDRESRRLLDLFHLDRAKNDMIESYSHGMRQKLILAAALIHDPALLVVDEPTVGLDPRGVRQIRDILRELASQGKTIFLSTHSLPFAEETCHRIGIVDQGAMIACGTSQELKALSHEGHEDLEELFLELTS